MEEQEIGGAILGTVCFFGLLPWLYPLFVFFPNSVLDILGFGFLLSFIPAVAAGVGVSEKTGQTLIMILKSGGFGSFIALLVFVGVSFVVGPENVASNQLGALFMWIGGAVGAYYWRQFEIHSYPGDTS